MSALDDIFDRQNDVIARQRDRISELTRERDAAVRERDELREQVRVAAKPWADDVRLSARIAKDAETRAQNLAAQIVDEKVEAAQEQVVEAIAAWFESLIRKMPNMYVGDFYTATEVARHIRAGKWRKEQP